MFKNFNRIFLILIWVLAATSQLEAKTKRILVVGDSWAAGMTHPLLGKTFQTTLNENGLKDIAVVATDQTARPGWAAANWASNHQGSLDTVKKALQENPTVDIVFVVTGGADFLALANQTNLSKLLPEERAKLWKSIATDIQKLVDTILAVRPQMKAVLCDYDYLNNEKTAKSFLKWTYHGISQEDFNRCFVELGREKKAIAEKTPLCFYVQNWGVLQHAFGKQESKTVPLPGGLPKFDPYPGGDATKPGPAAAFGHLLMNDGIHPNSRGYRLLIENALKQGLGDLLRTNAVFTNRATSAQ